MKNQTVAFGDFMKCLQPSIKAKEILAEWNIFEKSYLPPLKRISLVDLDVSTGTESSYHNAFSRKR
jgi:hypothetical protein